MHWTFLNSLIRPYRSALKNWGGWVDSPLWRGEPVPDGGPGLAWNQLVGGPILQDWLTGRAPVARWTNLTISDGHGDPSPEGEDLEGIYHIPVMPDEVVEWLAPAPGKLLMDGTFGGGGHTKRLLARGAGVLALDRDADALMQAGELAHEWPADFVALRTTFDQYPAILKEAGVGGVDGILLDVGVSSWQVDSPNRGFSFRFEGPLDMRMDRDAPLTAEEVVNTWPEEELARIFYTYGEEKASRRAAAAIVARRKQKAISTTADLAELLAKVIPKHSGAHPATKVFQALRIAVNDELGCLERALEEAHRWLRPGGRLVVITFHSLEDRIVKNYMRRHSEPFVDRPEWSAARPNPECFYRLPVRKAITAGEAELAVNPRARSAKLRVAERLP
jgi:16S rRNA (cytosine1402-N4)-methyltransferase